MALATFEKLPHRQQDLASRQSIVDGSAPVPQNLGIGENQTSLYKDLASLWRAHARLRTCKSFLGKDRSRWWESLTRVSWLQSVSLA